MRDWHEVLDDEQNLVNDYVATIDVPQLGPTRTVGNLVHLSETPGSVKGGPPLLGEGNAEILVSLGVTAADIAAMDARVQQVGEELLAPLR